MAGFNLPPGCRESDLPGYHDIEVDTTIDCPNCGEIETVVVVDSRYGEYEDVCPDCDAEISGWIQRGEW